MFTIVKNYRKIFLSFIKNDLEGGGGIPILDNATPNKELTNLNNLKQFIKDGKINYNEATFINEEMSDISEETKKGLKEIGESMLNNGFSVMNEKSYNSFKSIIEKGTTKLPKWSSIIRKTIDNMTLASSKGFNELHESKFHGIIIKGKNIKVRYEVFGSNNTLDLNYTKNGSIENGKGWIMEDLEENDVLNKGIIKDVNLDDNIDIVKKESLIKKEIADGLKELDLDNYKEVLGIIRNSGLNITPYSIGKAYELGNKDKLKIINILKVAISKIEPKAAEPKAAEPKAAEPKAVEAKAAEAKAVKSKENLNNTFIAKLNSAKEYYKRMNVSEEKMKQIQVLVGAGEDGQFGPNTFKAIMQYQKNNGLTVDGKAGFNTLKGLIGETAAESFYKTNDKKSINKSQENSKEQNEKAEQINIKVTPFSKEDIAKVLQQIIETTNGTEHKISTYSYILNGEKVEGDVNLYSVNGSLKVELDGTGIFNDLDTKVNYDTVMEGINKLVKEYESEINKELKEGFDEKMKEKQEMQEEKVQEKQEEQAEKDEEEKEKQAELSEENDERLSILKELKLTDEDLTKDDLLELKDADEVNIDLSDIELVYTSSTVDSKTNETTVTNTKYEIDIDGSNNLIIEKDGSGLKVSDEDGTLLINFDNNISFKDAIIKGTAKLNHDDINYIKPKQVDETYYNGEDDDDLWDD